jgi:hypothetical protein
MALGRRGEKRKVDREPNSLAESLGGSQAILVIADWSSRLRPADSRTTLFPGVRPAVSESRKNQPIIRRIKP